MSLVQGSEASTGEQNDVIHAKSDEEDKEISHEMKLTNFIPSDLNIGFSKYSIIPSKSRSIPIFGKSGIIWVTTNSRRRFDIGKEIKRAVETLRERRSRLLKNEAYEGCQKIRYGFRI